MPDNSICVFTTLRASLEDTLAFAYYHLNIGVDHMFLFFDDPQDPAIAMLAQETRVTCIHCDAKYWEELARELPQSDLNINAKQEINSQVATRMAREQGYDWICHIDSDELIYARNGFEHFISAIPPHVQVARLPVLEVIPEELSVQAPFQELHYFKNAQMVSPKKIYGLVERGGLLLFHIRYIIYRIKWKLAKLLGSKLARSTFIKGHKMGKSMARTSAPMLSFPTHFPLPSEGPLRSIFFPQLKILHFDAPDYARWKTKWLGRYEHYQKGFVLTKLGPSRKKQYNEFVKVYELGSENDLIALFKSNYFVSPSELEILLKIGLVCKIHLNDKLFLPPIDSYRPWSEHR